MPATPLNCPSMMIGIGLLDDHFALVDIGLGDLGDRVSGFEEQLLAPLVVKARLHIDERFELQLAVVLLAPVPVRDEASFRIEAVSDARGDGRGGVCLVLTVRVRFIAEVSTGKLRILGENIAGQGAGTFAVAEQAVDLSRSHDLGRENCARVAAFDLGGDPRSENAESFFPFEVELGRHAGRNEQHHGGKQGTGRDDPEQQHPPAEGLEERDPVRLFLAVAHLGFVDLPQEP